MVLGSVITLQEFTCSTGRINSEKFSTQQLVDIPVTGSGEDNIGEIRIDSVDTLMEV